MLACTEGCQLLVHAPACLRKLAEHLKLERPAFSGFRVRAPSPQTLG